MLSPVAIAFGSNLGDRERIIREAASALAPAIHHLTLSSLQETAPVGVGLQPAFLNAAGAGETTLPARELLDRLLATEQVFGRARPYPGAPRTLDLDLILYGSDI